MPHREGQRFDDYQLLHLLGAGTFGEVYAAEHIYDHEQVALKIIKHQLSPANLKEFLREARTLLRLKHPHIIALLDFGIEDAEQLPFLAMSLASHDTLLQRHQRGTRLDVPLVVTYVEQIASALHYAHERRLIHRDVKPANVLLGARDELLLSDFGIAAIAHSEHSMRTQDVVGTAAYMAPEQIMGKPQPASDQYALAIMAYEWLCGSLPFRGSQLELFACHLHAMPDAPRLRNPQLPQGIETVLLKALTKDPAARFPTIQAFAQALSQANPTSTPKLDIIAFPERSISPSTQSDPKIKEDWPDNVADLFENEIQYTPKLSTPPSTQGDPKTKEDWLNKGSKLVNLGRYEEALDAYERSIALDPNYALAHYGKGLVLYDLKHDKEALHAYNRAIALNPNYPDALYNKGLVLYRLKRYDEALNAYDRVLALDPNYTNAYTGKGLALDCLKSYQEALTAYNRAIALNPNDALTHYNIGVTLGNLKRYNKALDAYNRAIALDPNDALAHYNKGLALYHLKRYEEALDAYNRTIALDPSYANAHYGKSLILDIWQRPKEARAAFAKARELGYQG